MSTLHQDLHTLFHPIEMNDKQRKQWKLATDSFLAVRHVIERVELGLELPEVQTIRKHMMQLATIARAVGCEPAVSILVAACCGLVEAIYYRMDPQRMQPDPEVGRLLRDTNARLDEARWLVSRHIAENPVHPDKE